MNENEKRKRLTVKRFYRHLAGLKKKGWLPFIEEDSNRYGPDQGDLIFLQMPSTEMECCPITAVCFDLADRLFKNEEYEKAAKAIGLDSASASRIMKAADGADGHPIVRARLLKATRLKEPKAA